MVVVVQDFAADAEDGAVGLDAAVLAERANDVADELLAEIKK